jgi:hypothetical protein
MTQARRHLVDPKHAGTYHCINRCVRRSWLCGLDSYTRKSFEHQKPWVEKRILELGEICLRNLLVGGDEQSPVSGRVHEPGNFTRVD